MPKGADAVVMVEHTALSGETRVGRSSPRRRASTSAAPAATWWPAKWPWPGHGALPCQTRRGRGAGARLASTCSSGRGSRSSLRATRLSRRAERSGRRRSSTRIRRRWPRPSGSTAANPSFAPRVGDDREALTTAFERCLRPGPRPVLRRHVGWRARLPARDHRRRRDRALRGPAAEARQADGVCDRGGPAGLRHAGQPRVVPHQRVPAGGASSAAHGAPAAGAERVVLARLATEVESPAGRHQIYPVRVDGDGAVPVFKGSGEITSLAHADGYFEIAAESGAGRSRRRGAGDVVLMAG